MDLITLLEENRHLTWEAEPGVGTDKGGYPGEHDFVKGYYNEAFKKYQDKEIDLLEIGVFGGAEQGKIGTQIQRLLQQAGGKGVVHGHHAVHLVGGFADGLDVENFKQRIGGRFQPHQRGLEPRDEVVVLWIGEVGVFDFDAETLQHLFENAVGAAINLLLGEDQIARLE